MKVRHTETLPQATGVEDVHIGHELSQQSCLPLERNACRRHREVWSSSISVLRELPDTPHLPSPHLGERKQSWFIRDRGRGAKATALGPI